MAEMTTAAAQEREHMLEDAAEVDSRWVSARQL